MTPVVSIRRAAARLDAELAEHERASPYFKERAELAKENVKLALLFETPITAAVVAGELHVRVPVAARWLDRLGVPHDVWVKP